MSWRKSYLFGFSVIIDGIFVKNKSSYFDFWIISMVPNFGYIKNIPSVLFPILFRHNLNIEFPNLFIFFNIFKQISCCKIWIIFSCISFFSSKIFNSLLCFEMKFNPKSFTLFIYPSVCMTSVSIHVSITIRSSAIRK